MTTAYTKRAVAFLDVLGWSAATESADALERVFAVASHLRDSAVARTELALREERRKFKERGIPFEEFPWFRETQIAAFSDSIIISTPLEFGSRVLSHVAHVAHELLRSGFLARGAVVIGDVYHHEGVAFGPAVNKAIALEKQATLPRIVCDDEIVRMVHEEKIGGLVPLFTDMLGRQIVNLLDPPLSTPSIDETMRMLGEMWQIDLLRENIQRGIAGANQSGNQSHIEKWAYMQDTMEAMVQLARQRIVARLENPKVG